MRYLFLFESFYRRPALRYFGVLLFLYFSVWAHAIPANAPTVEYQVKASLVFNFMHFVEWPPEVLGSENNELSVCLAGPDLYGAALEVLTGEVVQGKTLIVKTYPAEQLIDFERSCQVVVFPGKNRSLIASALPDLAGKSILTIGDDPEFLQQGGIIKFEIVKDTVRFDINLDAAKKSRLLVSSKLLRLAHNVVTSK